MTREDEGRGDPGNPGKDGEEGGCPDSFGLPVVLGRGPEQGGEAEAGKKEKEDVGEGEEVRLGGGKRGAASRSSAEKQQLPCEGELNQHGEEEEQRLVKGGEVNPLVEGPEVDKADEEAGVDEGIRHWQEDGGKTRGEGEGLERHLGKGGGGAKGKPEQEQVREETRLGTVGAGGVEQVSPVE